MTHPFENNAKPQGGMAAFSSFSSKSAFQKNDSEGSVWSQIWAHRGPFDFSLKKNEDAKICFLTDIMVFPAHEVIYGWVEKGYSFPSTDFVRSSAWNADGTESGEPDYIGQITGRDPRILGVAVILDTRPYTNKDGEKIPFTVRRVVIKQQAVMDVLKAMTETSGQDLRLARFQVSRTGQDKSARIGDSWFPQTYVTEADLDAHYGGWREALEKIDLDKGYPTLDKAQQLQVMQQYGRVADKHSTSQSWLINYNKDVLEQLLGGGDTTAAASNGNPFDMNASSTPVADAIDAPVDAFASEVTDLGDGTALDDIM